MEIGSKDIFDVINRVRENPSLVLNEIKDQLKRFQSNSVYRTKRDIKIRAISGKTSWQDAVLALQRQKSKGNLQWNSVLGKAVEEYRLVAMQDDSISPFDVIKRFCSYQGNISFNVNQSDTEQDVMEIVAAMVIGDGDEKKGSRTAIFHPLFRQFACAIRKVGNKNIIYTVYAQSVSEPQASNPSSKKPENKQISGNSESNWSDVPAGKKDQGAISNKYKPVEEELNTKEALIKKGKELIVELNKIRKEPKQYVHALKAELQKFKDDKTITADHGTIVTKEGQPPYYDLISELESQYPLPTIREVTGLSLVAIEQIIQAESMVEYKVPVENLLNNFCASSEGVRSIKLRDIEGMPISAILMRLLVGDGDRKRTGRKKLLSPICKAVGCAVGRNIMVINVGETAKDNREVVEQYMEYINEPINVKSPKKSQQQEYFQQQNKVLPSFGKKQQIFGDQTFVIKKTSKSHNIQRGGRVYMVTETEIIFNNGFIEKKVEEELVR